MRAASIARDMEMLVMVGVTLRTRVKRRGEREGWNMVVLSKKVTSRAKRDWHCSQTWRGVRVTLVGGTPDCRERASSLEHRVPTNGRPYAIAPDKDGYAIGGTDLVNRPTH